MRWIVLGLALLLCPMMYAADNKPLELRYTTFKAEVTDTKGLVIVDFYGDFCHPCREYKPILELFTKDTKYKVCTVIMENSPTLFDLNNIPAIPCTVFYKDGKEVDRHYGIITKEKLQEYAKLYE